MSSALGSSLILRTCTYALSAGAHVMVAFATFGHAAPGNAATDVAVMQLAPADVEVPVDVVPAEPPPVLPAAEHAALPHSHTHAYPVPFDHDAHPHDPSLVHVPLAAHEHDDHDHEAAAAPVAEAPAAAPHFSMHVANNDHVGGNGADDHAHGSADSGGGDPNGTPFAEAAVSAPARLVGALSPAYPPSARQAEIEADVALEIVVAKDGRVLDAHVVRAAGYGFDAEALRSVRAARFTPAVHDGVAVPVRMRWTVSFRLR